MLMITYNHRPYIERAIESVLAQQTAFEVELLLADDCSTDGTKEIASDLASQNPGSVRLIGSDTNVGAHANVLRTERACRGKYVAYCEGDDVWSAPDKLAKQVRYLEERPQYVMVHSHCHRYLVGSQRLLSNSLTVPEDLDDSRAYEDMLLGRRYALTVTVMARREALWTVVEANSECTDPKWPMGDTQRWLELSRLGKVGCIHEPLATTNILPESAGQSRDPAKRLRFALAARELQLHYLKKYPVDTEIDQHVRRQLAWSLLQTAGYTRDAAVANEMYEDFVRHGGRPGLTARCLRWGAKSPVHRRLVFPYLKLEARWRRLVRRRVVSA